MKLYKKIKPKMPVIDLLDDTTKTKKTVNQAKDLLNGLFGKKKTP